MKVQPKNRSNINTETILLYFTLFFSFSFYAQSDDNGKFSYGGFGEMYYSYDFSNPQNHEKADFLYNHKRHNELNVNLIVLKSNYTDKTTRANLGVMVGNYAQYNMSSEPNWAQFIYEANIGVKLLKDDNLWLDAGIMPSHIGFESAISADCWTLTRSILAENSPYYETGLKLGYTNKKENLNLAFLLLNGWQRIEKPDYIQTPSVGMQINYKPTNRLIINYSNFLGSNKPDSLKSVRTFHNFYIQYETKRKIDFIVGFDIGTEKDNDTDYGTWFSPVGILRYRINNSIKIAARGEYYSDKKQKIIATNTTEGFQVLGLSTNFDYALSDKVQFRVEAKMFQAQNPIFINEDKRNYSLTSNMTIRL
jgi:hypothetical protein